MSTISPTVGDTAGDLLDSIEGTSLLDLDVDLDADLDAAAPINAGVAANANAALPIDAAVSANTLSPGAQSLASASQDSLLSQNIDADAIANSTQDSTIGQGEAAEDPAPAPDPAETDPSSLLDLDANVDLGLDLAAPVDAAVAANANIAAPIDAAVSANTLSPDATSIASADQDSVIVQNIEGSRPGGRGPDLHDRAGRGERPVTGWLQRRRWASRETSPPRRPSGGHPSSPRLAHGVELIGEFEDSGFKEPPLLARRADGQVVQLTQLLYLVAEACDGDRDVEAVADAVTERFGRRVSGENVAFLVEEKLRPLGVLAHADGSTPKLEKREALLALRHRKPVLSEPTVNASPACSTVAAPAVRAGPAAARRRGLRRLALRGPRARRRPAERALRPGAAPLRARVDRRRDRVPRARPRQRVPVRRRAARRHGRRRLPRVARLLLRRDGRLPAQPRGPAADGSRRRLLQRDLRAARRGRLLRHGRGGGAAGGVPPARDPPPAAPAAAALRRLLRPQRPHRRAGHPLAHQADLPLDRPPARAPARGAWSSSRGCASS